MSKRKDDIWDGIRIAPTLGRRKDRAVSEEANRRARSVGSGWRMSPAHQVRPPCSCGVYLSHGQDWCPDCRVRFTKACGQAGRDPDVLAAYFRPLAVATRRNPSNEDMPPTTAPQLASLFLEQAGQCALTGWDMGLSLTDPRAAVPVPVAKKPVVPSVIEDWFYTSAERRTNAEKHAREVQAWRDAGVVLVSAIAATRMRGLTFMEFLSAKPGDRPSRRELAERLKARAR